jgi:hypothetical protein
MRKFWFNARLRRLAFALLATILVAIVITYFTDTENKSLLKRGDFPGFYVLSEIKNAGLMERLYDPELQRSIENKIWPGFQGSFYMSAYPAFTATLLYPLSFFNAQIAQIIFSGFMLICFFLSIHIISKLNATIKENFFPNAVFALCFAPVFYSLFGAQNTALSMLLYSAIIYFLKKETKISDLSAGICAGLWLFKPQFALFMIAMMIVSRLWFSLIGAACVAALFQAIAAVDCGFFWFIDWIKTLQIFSDQNFISNAPQIVSISGTLRAFSSNPALNIVSACITVLITVALFLKVWKVKRTEFPKLFLLFGPLLVLISPQTLFYDLGIALASYLAILDFNKDSTYWKFLALNFTSAAVVLLREEYPFPIFFIFAIYIGTLTFLGTRDPSGSNKITI